MHSNNPGSKIYTHSMILFLSGQEGRTNLVNSESPGPGAEGWLDAEMLFLGMWVHLLLSTTIYLFLDAPLLIWGKEWKSQFSLNSHPHSTFNSLIFKCEGKSHNVPPLLRKCCREPNPHWEIEKPNEMIRRCWEFRGREADGL